VTSVGYFLINWSMIHGILNIKNRYFILIPYFVECHCCVYMVWATGNRFGPNEITPHIPHFFLGTCFNIILTYYFRSSYYPHSVRILDRLYLCVRFSFLQCVLRDMFSLILLLWQDYEVTYFRGSHSTVLFIRLSLLSY
jgi:hypothetical protein